MEEWKEYKIGDICRIKHGFAFKGIHFVDEPQKYVCVTPGNFALKGGFKNDKPKYYNGPIPEDYVLQKDDLVVTMTDLSKNGDTLGYSALIPYDEHYTFLHNQRIGLIEDISNDIDKHFLYWVMRTYDYQRYIVGHCSGSTVKHTSPSGIGSYIFRCPDMKMQKEIASILDNLDDKIEVNRRINDNLEQQAQALFKSWFVDFEPFRDQPFVESELGMIPEGWRVVSLGDLMSYNGGSQPPASEFVEDYKDGYVRFIQIRDYASDGHITYIPISKRNKLCDIRDIMIARYGASLGRICYGLRGAYNVALAKVTPIEPYYLEFLRCYLNTREFYEGINNKGNRAVQAGFNQSDIQSFRIAFPNNEDIIQNFENVCSAYFDNRLLLEQESRRLAELRDTLLPRLMSGELSVDGLKGQFAVSPGRCPGSKEHVSNKTAL